MRGNTNIHCRLVRNRDPWSQCDSGEISSLLPEENVAHRAPFPLTVSGTFGLLKGEGVRDIRIQKSHSDDQGVIPC